jgi:hypothetical protein
MITDVKKNITSIFMVPTLKINRDILKDNGFVNGYLIDCKKDVQYKDCIYILFKPENIETFKEFLQDEYETTKSIVEDYDYEDGFVVVVYQLNSNFKKDFELIKQGKYSKTSRAFQETFPKIVKIKVEGLHKDELSLQYRVFNKTEDLREYWENKIGIAFDETMEVWTGWDEETEILNIDKLKEYV